MWNCLEKELENTKLVLSNVISDSYKDLKTGWTNENINFITNFI
jgi:hypothetical protein